MKLQKTISVLFLTILLQVAQAQLVDISGFAKLPTKKGISGVTIQVFANTDTLPVAETVTNAQGYYQFRNLPSGPDYRLRAVKPQDDPDKGLDIFDVKKMRDYLLAIRSFDSPWYVLAADFFTNQSVSTVDIVHVSRTILGYPITTVSPDQLWKFYDARTVPAFDPEAPFNASVVFNAPVAQLIVLKDAIGPYSNIDFTGIKLGDVDGSYQP